MIGQVVLNKRAFFLIEFPGRIPGKKLFLFTRMNQAMKTQEQSLIWCPSTVRIPNVQWSVVFGGKWADVACSIAEQLVDLLLSAEGGGDSRVYTVSRTPTCGDPAHQPPSNVVHLPKLNLETEGGPQEFEDVLNRVIDDWEKEHNFNGSSSSTGNGSKTHRMVASMCIDFDCFRLSV